MMVDADHLRIVFQVNDVDFVMPVADLLAIRGLDEDDLALVDQPSEPFQLGSLSYRETDVRVYDLALLFNLKAESNCEEGPLLIFAGADSPWAVRVNHVVGVFDTTHFEFQDLPVYLFHDEFVPYHQVALHDGQLLVSVDSQQIDQAWHRGT
jgi:chemotaxis signal transduction protein